MEEMKYHCYICGKEITEENKTDEHIILNAIGGHLHSYTILCKDCNSKMGDHADAQLAKDLSFFTNMLLVKRNRKKVQDVVMTDNDGKEIVVKEAGKELELLHPYKEIEKDGKQTTVKLTVRNKRELEGLLIGMVKSGDITKEQADKIKERATNVNDKPVLHTQTSISTDAFPSIIKSAVDFYVDRTQDIATVQHLIPYITQNPKCDCREVLFLHHFKTLPYSYNKEHVTHMVHIEGSKETGLLYAMMEYYSIYIYIVVLDNKYHGQDINMTYTWDVVGSSEIERNFSLHLKMKDLLDFRNQPHNQYLSYLPFVKQRADNVMRIWQHNNEREELHNVLENAFSKIPKGKRFDENDIAIIKQDIMNYVMRKINNSEKLN